MKRFFFLMLMLCTLIAVQAENYPYRSDYLWVTVPDHADWLYKTGEKATVEVQFYKYGIPRDGLVEWEIGTDLLPADQHRWEEGRTRLLPLVQERVAFQCHRHPSVEHRRQERVCCGLASNLLVRSRTWRSWRRF